MEQLAALVENFRDYDAYGIRPLKDHALWESASLPHCSSPAAWRSYRSEIAQLGPGDWTSDANSPDGWRGGCSQWPVYRDALARIHAYLRNRGVPLWQASVSPPRLERLCQCSGAWRRGLHHLLAYVRVDFDCDGPVILQFAEGGEEALAPGALLLVSGFRRHRLSGRGYLVSFGIRLPGVARVEALETPALLDEGVYDGVVFAAATLEPLDQPLPPPDLLTAKLDWLNDLHRRRFRQTECPAVQRFLVDRENPDFATGDDIERIRRHGLAGDELAPELVTDIPVLSEEQCLALCRYAADSITSVRSDSVDDDPEYQVDLRPGVLESLIGKTTAEELIRLPERLGRPTGPLAVDCFLRCYSPDTRAYITFHSDVSRYTVNIPLNDCTDFQGGELLAVIGGRLSRLPRTRGHAIVHGGNIVHGVTRISAGLRYNLVMFFGQVEGGTRPRLPLGAGVARPDL